MKKIPGNLLKKTWKNHGNIMEFCQSEKVGTLNLASTTDHFVATFMEYKNINVVLHDINFANLAAFIWRRYCYICETFGNIHQLFNEYSYHKR